MHPGKRSCSCPSHNKVRINNPHYPLLSGLVIALLPKCPFCILAYTSAITICSAKSLTEYSPQWTSWISVVLSFITLGIVAWNFKGRKTMVACVLIASGAYLIVRSELFTGMIQSYYWGCALLFAGVWTNGSLQYFIKLLFSKKPFQLYAHG